MSVTRSVEPVTDDRPVMKVTVYLKSGSVVSFPGRYINDRNGRGFLTAAPMEIGFVDFDAVALVIQEPWTGES